MTISKRLALALAASIISLLAVGAIGLLQMNRAHQRFEYFQDNVTVAVDDLNNAVAKVYENRILLLRWSVQNDPATKKSLASQLAANVTSTSAVFDKYERDDINNAEDKSMLEADRAAMVPFIKQQQLFMTVYTDGNVEGAHAMMDDNGSLRAASVAIQTTVQKHIDWNVKRGKLLRETNREAYVEALWTLVIVIVATSLCSGGLIYNLQKAIARSLKGIQTTLEDARVTLDLTRRVEVIRMDEIGHTAKAFNDLQDHVEQVISSVRVAIDTVRLASHEIASGNSDLSSRTEEQAASLEQTASSMAQLTETVKQNADNARQANMLAGNASALADTGNHAVVAMVETIGQISDRSIKISEITGVIEGIAFQTNILALNAAVEAARAGEQGRGFAVVASEVRSLAQRSSTAAKEIKALIESSVATVQGGAEQAREVGSTMAQVKQAIKQVSDIVAEIAAASDEQKTGIEQINQAVNQMDEVTQQNAALVEEAAAAAQSLDQQAVSLKDAVSVFKVRNVSGNLTTSTKSSTPGVSLLTRAQSPTRSYTTPAVVSNKPLSDRKKQSIDSGRTSEAEANAWETF
ncbi:methyl-accepting chemotaxis protein [Paraburkholderia sp. SIMBA_049]